MKYIIIKSKKVKVIKRDLENFREKDSEVKWLWLSFHKKEKNLHWKHLRK